MACQPGNLGREGGAGSFVERLRNGDPDAWAKLVTEYSSRLERLARRIHRVSARREGPEDVVNSVFKSLFRRIHRDGTAQPVEDLSAFLNGMLVYKLHERHSKHTAQKRDVRREEQRDPAIAHDLVEAQATPSAYVQFKEEVCRILDALTPIEQAVFELSLDGYVTKDIAEVLDYSQRSVQLWKKPSRQKLRNWATSHLTRKTYCVGPRQTSQLPSKAA